LHQFFSVRSGAGSATSQTVYSVSWRLAQSYALLTMARVDYYDPLGHPNFVDWLLRKMAVKACLEVAAVLSF
jgi:hypothetical protein